MSFKNLIKKKYTLTTMVNGLILRKTLRLSSLTPYVLWTIFDQFVINTVTIFF